MTPKDRSKRKRLMIIALTLIAAMAVLPVAFIEKTIAIQPIDYYFNHVETPFISDILNQNVLLTLIGSYFSPLVLYLALYLLLPSVIVNLTSSFKICVTQNERDQSIRDSTFYTMVASNLLFTGLELMLIGNFIYLFVDIDSENKKKFYEDLQQTNFAFKILP
jgi:hypothetical protein